MQITPVDHRILVQFHFPDQESGIILPDSNLSTSAGDKRTIVEVLKCGGEVTVCAPGDFLLVHADVFRNAVPVTKEPPTALIHDSVVLAIVLDDAQHVR